MTGRADGHRCRYETREGKGPRGGRRTWTVATCADCGAEGESADRRPGSSDHLRAHDALRERVPHCPTPHAPSEATRALASLAGAVGDHERTLPRLPWAVQWAPDGDLDGALARAWALCEDPRPMLVLLGRTGAVTRGWAHALGEAGDMHADAQTEDGLSVALDGPGAVVAAALRRLFPPPTWDALRGTP